MWPASSRKMLLLGALYFAEGLPFGFQSTALPAYLRASGVSLAGIGFLGALSLPWIAKPLWAPLIDRFGSKKIGRRKSWILPLQLLLALTCGAAALVPPEGGLFTLLGLVFAMNFLAATQDIAIDGWAIDMLTPEELGGGNAVQVVGYKAGMLTGGGLLVYLSASIGWTGLFAVMGALVLVVFIVTLSAREAPPVIGAGAEHPSIAAVLSPVVELLRRREARWVVAFVATYKTGEAMIDSMFKPFLVDQGIEVATIGLWIGTYGLIASLLGSLAGGWIATRFRLVRAVAISASLRVIPMIGIVALSRSAVTAERVIAITCVEYFFAGALTTAMFAFMMSSVDRRIGATHYAILAAIEVGGKSIGPWIAGFVAQAHGYSVLFAIGAAISLLFLLLLAPISRRA